MIESESDLNGLNCKEKKTKMEKENKRFSVLDVSGMLYKFETLEKAKEYTKNFKEGDFQISEYDEKGKFVKRI